jgi:hypothetical protein
MKKIAFINFHNLWPVHQETELEIMSKFENNDFEIFKFHCNSSLKYCDLNPKGEFSKCNQCRYKDLFGLSLIKKNVKLIQIKTNPYIDYIPSFKSIDDLKIFKYDGFDVGYAVLSSIISENRDPYLDVDLFSDQIVQSISRSIELYKYFVQIFEEYKFIEVYIFNGRFAYERAALRAAEKVGVKYFTHERGSSKDKYMLFKNTLPHDLVQFRNLLEFSWQNDALGIDEKKKIGEAFFIERKNSVEQGWVSFTNNQNQKDLPKYWNAAKKNIVIYLSSEDEFMAIGDQWEKTIFLNQIEGLKFLLNEMNNEFTDDYIFTIRIHPNSLILKQFVKEINSFANDKVFVINPESSVGTYLLMEHAWKVITFGSTMGIESSYWGKVSINLGNSFYRQLNVTHNPCSKSDILELIFKEKNSFSSSTNLLKYGYYMKTYGIQYQNYYPIDLFNGEFCGNDLNNLTVSILNNKWIHQINYFATTLFKFEFKRFLENNYLRIQYFLLKK